MSQMSSRLMGPSEPGPLYLRGSSTLSLNERFSQVLVDQLTQPRTVTFDPVQLQRRTGSTPLVLLLKGEASLLPDLQTRDPSVRMKQRVKRRSVWTRLGWQKVTRRRSASGPRGFWSFRNKYRWRARFCSTCSRRGNLCSDLGQQRLLKNRTAGRGNLCSDLGQQRLLKNRTAGRGNLCSDLGQQCLLKNRTAGRTQLGVHLQRGGAAASRGRVRSKADVPTKKQLDAQLDQYMSASRSRLDRQLDDYMSLSKSRLDAQLDEYMSMAGQTDLLWD
ncbi:chromatin target of PRMT1 protein-like isoform X2 [Sparus aurata]|nr:chromatin target of PRMT1 protein-like isoform X2 [Sparus aurata]XP_030271565.1 chromatin target of PRMT1 protein-like isoform X2 [Sparus aurata]XP_030271566.1 chromatin target of PRMT1 protein-like isoform X2 [Sparus aurata]